MRRLQNIGDGSKLVIADAVTSLPYPIVTWGMVPDGWDQGPNIGVVPVLDVHFRAEDLVDLSSTKLYAGRRYDSPALVDDDLAAADINAGTNQVAEVAHGYLTGDGPFRWKDRAVLDLGTLAAGNLDTVIEAIEAGDFGNDIDVDIVFDTNDPPIIVETDGHVVIHAKTAVSTVAQVETAIGTSTQIRVKTPGTGATVLSSATDNFPATPLAGGDDAPTNIPGGTEGGEDQYVVIVDADHYKIAASLADALAGTTIDFTDVGSGEFVFAASSTTRRFHWSLLGNLGTINLDAQLAATVSIDHRPGVVAYACTATFSDTIDTTIELMPVVEVA